jgi:Right handed beta helix region
MRSRKSPSTFLLSILFLFFVFFWFSPKVFASTIVDADIVTDTVWTASQSPYIITQPVSVLAGATLTIGPGVVVKFQGSEIDVDGALHAYGTQAEPVVFTSYLDDSVAGDTNADGLLTLPKVRDWVGILFSGTTSASSLDHVIIKYSYVVTDDGSKDLSVSNTSIENSYYGIDAVGSHMSLKNFSADHIVWTGLYVENSSFVTGSNINITNVLDGDGIDVYDSSIFVADNVNIKNVVYGGIEAYTNSYSRLSHVNIDNVFSGGGIYAYTSSGIDITDSVIKNVDDNAVDVFDQSSTTIAHLKINGSRSEALTVFNDSNMRTCLSLTHLLL